MKYVFYQREDNPEKIALTVSEKGAAHLVKKGVIEAGTPTLEMDYVAPEEMDMETFLLMYNLDSAQFDNKKSPTKIVVNKRVALVEHLEFIRDMRRGVLEELDSLQVRYMAKGRQDVVDQIEKDKEVLRKAPERFNIKMFKDLTDLHSKIPTELFVNYEEKYRGM